MLVSVPGLSALYQERISFTRLPFAAMGDSFRARRVLRGAAMTSSPSAASRGDPVSRIGGAPVTFDTSSVAAGGSAGEPRRAPRVGRATADERNPATVPRIRPAARSPRGGPRRNTMRRGARIASLALACGLAVLACERGRESTAAPAAGAAVAASAQPATGGRGNPVVLIQTSKGTLKVELDAEHAPISVKNFLAYADAGFYDGTIFHRVIDGFMIQGGGFTPDMTQKPTNAPIKNEAGNGLQNRRGTLAMARTASSTARRRSSSST